MKQVLRTISFLSIFLFIEGFLLSVSARTETANKEVLVLNSINFNLPWAKNFYWCIHDALQKGNMIDVEAEIARMEAELKHKEGFLQGVMKKLSNEKFVNNAPAAVLELERKKQTDAESIINSLKESIAALKKA